MDIRPLEEDDFVDAVRRVKRWYGEILHEPVHPVFFRHFGGYVAVDEDGSLLGYLLGFRSQRHPQVAFVYTLAVDPDRRREGVAGALYERFERQAAGWGCEFIETVADPNAAAPVHFLEKRGFLGQLVADWGGPGEDRIVYRKRIVPTV